jgi:hypothetical protein
MLPGSCCALVRSIDRASRRRGAGYVRRLKLRREANQTAVLRRADSELVLDRSPNTRRVRALGSQRRRQRFHRRNAAEHRGLKVLIRIRLRRRNKYILHVALRRAAAVGNAISALPELLNGVCQSPECLCKGIISANLLFGH